MPEQPTPQPAAQKDPVIYTIPEQFYGVAAKAQLPKDTPVPTTSMAIAPSPSSNEPPKPKKESGKKKWILIPVFAVVLLAGMGFAIWWFLRPVPPAQPAQPTVTLPTPEPQPEPVLQPEPQPEPEPTPQPDVASDQDSDGLSNAEESLYGTGPLNGDTDGDGYSDSIEVTNLYNPAGFKPTKLIEAGLVKEYTSKEESLAVLYPSTWTTNSTSSKELIVEFTDAAMGDAFSVARQENPGNQSLLDWYLTRNPAVSATQVQVFATKGGLQVLRTPDDSGGLSAYVDMEGVIYRLSYAQGPQGFIYRSTFTMFLNSFSKKP